jgi:hypothetical protein
MPPAQSTTGTSTCLHSTNWAEEGYAVVRLAIRKEGKGDGDWNLEDGKAVEVVEHGGSLLIKTDGRGHRPGEINNLLQEQFHLE